MSDDVTILHNPRCSTSRNALALLRERGIEPTVRRYLDQPLSRTELDALLAQLGQPARALLRRKEALAAELDLLGPNVSDERILAAMVAHPVLIERPVVVTAAGARIGRPLTALDAVLPPV